MLIQPPPTFNQIATAWHDRALQLAAWTEQRLVNRHDVWGAYLPLDRRDRGNSITAPAKSRRGAELLTADVLARHFCGAAPEHVIGLHSTAPDNTSRWGALDIDQHGEHSTAASINEAATLAWYDRLRQLGFSPLLTDSNGAGGFHLRALFAEPVPTPRVFAFLQWLVADHTKHGLPAPPEHFPKQGRIDPGRFGNWLRLPGRHHTRDHWSKVYDGGRWLDGAEAVEFILSLTGDPPTLIPADLPLPAASPAASRPRSCKAPASDLAGRIAAYMGKLPNLAEGYGRDKVAFQFGAFLVRDLRLSDAVALEWLSRWDQANRPPKGEDCLKAILANVHLYGKHDYGAGLSDPAPRRGRHAHGYLRFSFELEVAHDY